MLGIPEKELEETRAALAPTLEATAAILPWLATPRPPRFDAQLNARWIEACRALADAWSARHGAGPDAVRKAIFGLYAIAVETADGDCLRLGEALACAADNLDSPTLPPRLLAALTATVECLDEQSGLEHVLFAERARHFAQRIENTASPENRAGERSPALDRLFVSEATERMERMHEALASLPPDAYAIKLEAGELAQQAEHLELYGVVRLCRQLLQTIPEQARIDALDSPPVRQAMLALLQQLETTIATVDT